MTRAAWLLSALGLLQMAGDVLKIPAFKALGAASGASPAPKVFSSVRGLETYSTRFALEWRERDGEKSVPLDREIYRRMLGPYNRRNVYGAVLAYGPVLASDPRTRAMYESASRRAMCGDAPLLRELGIDPAAIVGPVRLRYTPRPGPAPEGLPLVLEVACP